MLVDAATSTNQHVVVHDQDALVGGSASEAGVRENFNLDDVRGCHNENFELALFVQQVQFRLPQGTGAGAGVKNARVALLTDFDKTVMIEQCEKWFPVSYPDEWYDAVTRVYSKYFSLGIFDTSHKSSQNYSDAVGRFDRLIGFIVADIKPLPHCLPEDLIMVKSDWPTDATLIAYIMVIGVDERYRRLGLATFLLQCLLDYTQQQHMRSCRTVYLHVLSTNTAACRFYYERGFRRLSLLKNYYVIDGQLHDSYLYAMYVNEPSIKSTRPAASSHNYYSGDANRYSAALLVFCSRLSNMLYVRATYRRVKRFFRWVWRAPLRNDRQQTSITSQYAGDNDTDNSSSTEPLFGVSTDDAHNSDKEFYS